MVFWRRNKPQQNEPSANGKGSTPSVRTVLGPGWQLKGRVYGKGHVVLQSVFEGELEIQGRLTVDPAANIKGSFRAEEIRIGGRLGGVVESSHILTLEKAARVEGRITTPRLEMADGAELNAEVRMETKGAAFQGIGG